MFWFMMLLLGSTINANASQPIVVSFHQLIDPIQASSYQTQQVSVRGFVYHDEQQNRWILAQEPNLKTCCVGSKHKIAQQIILEGDFSSSPPNQVVEVVGIFHDNKLTDASERKSVNRSWSIWILTLSLIFVISFFLFRAKKNK